MRCVECGHDTIEDWFEPLRWIARLFRRPIRPICPETLEGATVWGDPCGCRNLVHAA